MRDLEFRAWWKDTKRFLDCDEWYMTCSGAKYLHYAVMPYKDNNFIIEQYTGLKDKNGQKIYEGDIVRYGRHLSGIVPPEICTEIVRWRSGEEEYYPCCTTSGFSLPYSENGYEVIGNVHENPELLEVNDVD